MMKSRIILPSALLDACVLFPMYLRDTLLSTAEAGLYVPYWSQSILDEALGNLVLKGKISAEKATNLQATMKAVFPEAMVTVSVEVEAVKALSPDDFLTNLFDNNPEKMVQVVRQQAQKYKRRPMNFVELLTLLSKKDGANLPKFALENSFKSSVITLFKLKLSINTQYSLNAQISPKSVRSNIVER